MSCSPMKRVTATQQQIDNDTHTTIAVAETGHTETVGHVTTSREVDEQVVTTVVEYDTSQPTNPETGTPPIARTITQVRRTADKLSQDENAQKSEDTTREITAEKQQTESAVQITETTEKRGLSPIVKVLCCIGIVAVLGACFWVRRKLINKFIKPF